MALICLRRVGFAAAGLVFAAYLPLRGVSSQPPARPNIRFAIADDWSFGHAGAYGARWVRTPAFDRVAREGLLFSRAYTPNAKCAPSQTYDSANHMPLAVMWRRGIKAAPRVVDDYVSFVDLAATLIDLAGLKWSATGMQPTSGRSLTDILFSDTSGRISAERDYVLLGQELSPA